MLVERYVEAVKSGVGVEEILCLTFTEKAALELKERIGARIGSEIEAGEKSSGIYLKALKNARNRMLEANISTIHSFCAQALREFPVEAGIDANFKVLEDFDSATLKEESCDRAIREALADERTSHGNSYSLLVRHGYKKTLGLLNDLLDNREKIEHIKVKGRRLLLEEATVVEHWHRLSKTIIRIVRENVKMKKGNLETEIDELEGALQNNGDVLFPLSGLLRRILTKDGSPRKRDVELVSQNSSETNLSVLGTVHQSLSNLSPNRKGISEYLLLLNTLLNLFEKSVEHYDRKKFLMSALDFDDLQIKTMHLLRENESVRAGLASKFKHIMVDEFQDTNFLQYDIFLKLINGFVGGAKLFVVGDPKQSIYRFRNAQVEVSYETEKQVSDLEDGVAISLLESFRMNEDLASFVNEVFRKAMVKDQVLDEVGLTSSIQTEYKPLVARRQKGGEPAVEIFLAGEDEHAESSGDESDKDPAMEQDVSELQARFVASRIREMVDRGETIKDVNLKETSREIRYGDIAVLMRSRTRLSAVEKALNEYGVRYSVTSGIGFYSVQEIFDLTNYLSFLLDNNADVSLLAVLRSPFFGISDEELFRASLFKGKTLFEKFQVFAESRDASDEVKYSVSVLKDEIQLAHRFTIPQLINRILERTGWLGAYRLSATGEQRIANMRKLLSIAREFEGRGFNNLYDFIERLKYLKITAREGQAAFEEGADVVKVMTVHAAKGLEFPVVILPFCDASTNRKGSLIVDDQVGILPFIKNEFPEELSIYRRFETQNEEAEITRLFYVACTRAMDRLILTTSAGKPGSRAATTFSRIISRSFDTSTVPETGFYNYPGGRARISTEIPEIKNKSYSENLKSENGRKEGEEENAGLFIEEIPADIDSEIYSATLLQTFRLCPTKYFLRYRLGMPAPDPGFRRPEIGGSLDEFDDSILSTVKGEIVHGVLHDVLASGVHDEAAIMAAAEDAIGSRFGDSLDKEVSSKLLKQVLLNSQNAIATLRSLTGSGKLHLEETITRRFGTDFLTGTLDLFVEDEKGFHVFDYKTNRLDKGFEKIYLDYEIQMKLYASLCSKLIPTMDRSESSQQNVFDVTIIFTREPGRYFTKDYSRKDIEEFESELNSMLNKIKSIGLPGGTYPSSDDKNLPTSMPHCSECEYFVGELKKECLFKRK